MPTRPPTLWYFAYGSNMHPEIFLERRRMQPLDTRRGVLHGYRLAFDIPIGPGERAVANLTADDTAHVHGVTYLLGVDDCERLDRTEGVPQLYQRTLVDVVLSTGRIVPGFTYTSTISTNGRKPSLRYRGLLIDGARTHGLPEDYVAVLEALELAFDERDES